MAKSQPTETESMLPSSAEAPSPSSAGDQASKAKPEAKVWNVAPGCTIYIDGMCHVAGDPIYSDDPEQMKAWIDGKAIVPQ